MSLALTQKEIDVLFNSTYNLKTINKDITSSSVVNELLNTIHPEEIKPPAIFSQYKTKQQQEEHEAIKYQQQYIEYVKNHKRPDYDITYICSWCKKTMNKIEVYSSKQRKIYAIYCKQCNITINIKNL